MLLVICILALFLDVFCSDGADGGGVENGMLAESWNLTKSRFSEFLRVRFGRGLRGAGKKGGMAKRRGKMAIKSILFLYYGKKNVYLQSIKFPRGSTFQLETRRLRQHPWIGATVKSEPYMPMNLPGTPGTDPGERKNCPNCNPKPTPTQPWTPTPPTSAPPPPSPTAFTRRQLGTGMRCGCSTTGYSR